MNYYTVKEACQLSGELDATIRVAIKGGYIKSVKISSGNYVLEKNSFDRWREYRILKKAAIKARSDARKLAKMAKERKNAILL